MIKIITTRWIWKTSKILELANVTSNYIMCHNKERVMELWEIIQKRKLNIPQPISYWENISWLHNILIDDLDLIINRFKHLEIRQDWSNFIVDIDRTLLTEFWWRIWWYTMSIR